MRQPGRTLVTALALTVGLALVAFVSVLAAGTKATIDQAVSRSFAGNLIVENSQSGRSGIPAAVAPALRSVHGVGARHARSPSPKGRVRDLAAGTPVIAEEHVTTIEPIVRARSTSVEWEARLAGDAAGARRRRAPSSPRSSRAPTTCSVGQRLSVLTPTGR